MESAPTSCTIATFTASDRHVCHYRHYASAGPAQADIVCLHGIQSHGGWYETSCSRLAGAGFAVWFLDRRGSGLNEAQRGDAPSFTRLLDDVAEFLRTFAVGGELGRRRVPLFLSGVSWGGKLVIGLQRRHPGLVDGLLLLCPGFFPQVGVPFGRRLAILGTRFVNPPRRFPIPLNNPELFTTTPRWLAFLRKDPLALHEATARFLVESVRLDRYLRGAAKYVTVPTLLLLAGRDRVIRNDKTQQFFQQFAARDKNVITYADAHHTLEFEPQPEWYLAEVVGWLQRRCPRSPRGTP